jgi:hypothetical protein
MKDFLVDNMTKEAREKRYSLSTLDVESREAPKTGLWGFLGWIVILLIVIALASLGL